MDLTDILTDELEGEHCDAAWHARRYREMVREQIIAGKPVSIDAVPLELFAGSGQARYAAHKRRTPAPPAHPVLTDAQVVAFLSSLSPAELARLRVRLGYTGKAA